MKMMFHCTVLLMTLCIFESTSAQKKESDTFDHFWNTSAVSDSLKLQSIHKAIWKNELFSDPEKAFRLAKKQYDLAEKAKRPAQMAKALNTQGVSFGLRANYQEAVSYYTKSLAIRREIGDRRGVANTLGNIGLSQREQGNFVEAIQNFTESLKIHEELKNLKGQANALNNIGITYQDHEDDLLAIPYFERSLVIYKQLNDKQGQALVLTNLGITHKQLKAYDQAMRYFLQSSKLHEALNDLDGLSRTLSSIADIHYLNGAMEIAMEFETRSLEYRKRISDKRGIAHSLVSISKILLINKEYEKAINTGLEALHTAQEIKSLHQIQNASLILHRTYKAKKDFDNSLKMYELHIVSRDSIRSAENQREIDRQALTYKFEKEKAVSELEAKQKITIAEKEKEKSNLILTGVSLGTASLVFFLLVLYQRYRITNKQKVTIEEQYDNIEEKTQQIIRIEKEKHEHELLLKRKDLETVVANNSLQIKMKENLIASLREAQKSEDINTEVRNIILDLNRQIDTQQKLNLMETNLQEVNAKFFDRLQTDHPDISKTEKEICMYIKLGLSTKEIASLRNTTTNTINVTKTRLRNKLGLNSNAEINSYLLQF